MKKSAKILIAAAAALMLASCGGDKASVTGKLGDAAGKDLVVRLLDVNQYVTLDTVKTDDAGAFRFSVPVQKGQPEFIYIFGGGDKLASLILGRGDKVKISTDGTGKTVIEGSEESVLLAEVEDRFNSFAKEFAALDAAGATSAELGKSFVSHYRENVSFIMKHPFSMANIPVLYEKLNDYSPVFSQANDALLFRRVCDSLMTVYPESRYVKALEKETVRREKIMEMNNKILGAGSSDFPDLSMPDISGNKVNLSSLDAKALMVHFWNSSDAEQKMFNLDVLKPLYERYHSRGLEIYSVDVNPDKTVWATAVKGQDLPWINVNDGQGANSSALLLYNVRELPTSILIAGETLQSISGEAGLRSALDKLLK